MENAENVPQGSPEQEPISSLPTTEEALSGTETTQKELKQSTSELQTQPTDEHPLKPNGGHSPQHSKRNETPANEFQYANQGYEQEDPELGDISSNNTTTVVISVSIKNERND